MHNIFILYIYIIYLSQKNVCLNPQNPSASLRGRLGQARPKTVIQRHHHFGNLPSTIPIQSSPTRPTSRNTSSVTNTRIPCKHQAYPHPLQDSLFSTEGTLDLKFMKILVSLLSKAPERKRHAHSNHQSSGYCVADGDWDQVLKQNVQEGYGSAFTLQRDGCMKSSKTRVAHVSTPCTNCGSLSILVLKQKGGFGDSLHSVTERQNHTR